MVRISRSLANPIPIHPRPRPHVGVSDGVRFPAHPTFSCRAIDSTRFACGLPLMHRPATRLGPYGFLSGGGGWGTSPSQCLGGPFSSHQRLRRMRYCCIFALIFFKIDWIIGCLRMRIFWMYGKCLDLILMGRRRCFAIACYRPFLAACLNLFIYLFLPCNEKNSHISGIKVKWQITLFFIYLPLHTFPSYSVYRSLQLSIFIFLLLNFRC